jgi:hypothetical protein
MSGFGFRWRHRPCREKITGSANNISSVALNFCVASGKTGAAGTIDRLTGFWRTTQREALNLFKDPREMSYWWMYAPAVAVIPFFLGYLRVASLLQESRQPS